MKSIEAVLDQVIMTHISLNKQLGRDVSSVRIGKADLDIVRWTTPRKDEIENACKARQIYATFTESIDQFTLTFNIHNVIMSPSQSKHYMEIWGK